MTFSSIPPNTKNQHCNWEEPLIYKTMLCEQQLRSSNDVNTRYAEGKGTGSLHTYCLLLLCHSSLLTANSHKENS